METRVTDDTSKRNTNADNQPTPWVILVGLCVLFVLIVIIGIWVFLTYRGIEEKDHEFFRTVALSGTGLITAFLLFWRSSSAHTQAQNTTKAIENTNRQLQIMADANAQVLFEKGAGLLGSEQEAMQIAGTQALKTLALEQPKKYADVIIQMLESYIRCNSWPTQKALETSPRTNEACILALVSILEIINNIDSHHLRKKIINLNGIYLSDVSIQHETKNSIFGNDNLKIDFRESIIINCEISGHTIKNINFTSCNLSGTEFGFTVLHEVTFWKAILHNTRISHGLTAKHFSIAWLELTGDNADGTFSLNHMIKTIRANNPSLSEDGYQFWSDYWQSTKTPHILKLPEAPRWPPAKNP